MRKILTLAAAGLAAALSVLPAAAQNSGGDGQGVEQPAMAPSQAVKRAMQAAPGARALGVEFSGGIYVVRLKQDGTIIQLGVDPATGEVFPVQ